MSGLIKKIESLSQDYMTSVRDETISYALANKDKSKILNSWWLALIFFFDRVFYQGRRDEVSGMFEKATIKALEELLGKTDREKLDKLLSLEDRQCLEYRNLQKCPELYAALQRKYPISQPNGKTKQSRTGKERDREMTVDTLKFLTKNLQERDYNMLKYAIHMIRNRETRKLYSRLVEIRQIGDKTASFFLRDVVTIYGLDDQLSEGDYILLQPVDTWVRKVSTKLGLTTEKTSDNELKSLIIKACLDNNISPMKLNQGMWYLGSHSLDLIFKWYMHTA